MAEESKDRETQESTTLADRSLVEQRRLNASVATRSPSPVYETEDQKYHSQVYDGPPEEGQDDPAGYLTLDQKRSLLLPKLNYLKVEK